MAINYCNLTYMAHRFLKTGVERPAKTYFTGSTTDSAIKITELQEKEHTCIYCGMTRWI